MADGAIFHVDVSTVSRSQGRSAVAAAAYRAAEFLLDARTGLEHDFRRKQGVVESYIAAPDDCEWIEHRQALWDAAEAAENRKNSTVAREWLIALPNALDKTQRADLARAFATVLVTRYGVAVDVAIHKPNRKGDQRNHHAHLLSTTRKAEADGFGAKTRILDAAKTGSVEISEMREWWAGMVNDALEAADSDARVDHRRKSVIVAEMRAAAEALHKQAANIDALNVEIKNTSGLMKAVGKAARAIKDGGITTVTSKASDAPKLREQARGLELMAAELADTDVGKHDGPQLTAYKRRMAKAWEAEAQAKEVLRATQQAERERREAQEREKARRAEQARQNALKATQEAAERAEMANRYAVHTEPLIARARQDATFAKRITRWSIDLNVSDHAAARDPIWTGRGEGYDGQHIWSILTDEAEELDRQAKQKAERQRLANVEAFMESQEELASTFPTPSQKWKYQDFKALEPDSIQTTFSSKYRAKLTPDELTTTIRKILTRWVERIIEDIDSIKQGLSSVWLALTGGQVPAAKALEQATIDHPDIVKPLVDVLPKQKEVKAEQKPQVQRSKFRDNGPSM